MRVYPIEGPLGLELIQGASSHTLLGTAALMRHALVEPLVDVRTRDPSEWLRLLRWG